ncbi:MAG: hypothetical protein IJD10_00580 [Clostridia bacterium]|nr:hypothetical protein [Clostridia bacterium]
MKRFFIMLLAALLLLCSCGSVSVETELTETHTISSYSVTVPTPVDWKAQNEDTEFDLYLGKEDETLFFGVFCYRDDEVKEDLTPADVFSLQNDDILSASDKTTDIRASKTEVKADRTVYSRICKTEEGTDEYAYYLGMVDFDGLLVWFVGSTNVVLIEYYDDTFDAILLGIQATSKS